MSDQRQGIEGGSSRRRILVGAAAFAAAAAFPIEIAAGTAPSKSTKNGPLGFVTARDRTRLYVKDWGAGQPVVFSHGWPLSSDAFEDQMFFLASKGYRCVAHDRRGHGRSEQSLGGNDLDTFADDLADVLDALDLRNAVLVGHSTGGGEVARYIGRHGTKRVAAAVLISAIPPLRLRTPGNPGGAPIEEFDEVRKNVQTDRSAFWRELSLPFYGYSKPGAKVSEGLRESFWLWSSMAGFPASYLGVKAQSETDLTEDLRKFDVPTLILHGGADQLVPVEDSAILSAKLVRNATLKIHPGLPHGMCQTHKDLINADLLEFLHKAGRGPRA